MQTQVSEKRGLYSIIANLLQYPKENINNLVQECKESLLDQNKYSEDLKKAILKQLEAFQSNVESMSLDDLEGIYSYTFELTSEYTMDLGHHLLDGFKRSNSLATIKAMYRENEFPYADEAKGELSDNLVIILKFMDHLQDEDLKKNFREDFVIKGLEKLAKNFDRNKNNAYYPLVKMVQKVIESDVRMG